MSVPALLLAAGEGSRMGRTSAGTSKLLLQYRGVPLVCHVAKTVLGSRCVSLHVVVGACGEDVRGALLGEDAQLVDNPDWASGLASSLRAGVSAVLSREPACSALLVLLADQPHVTTAHIDALLAAHERAPDHLVASRYAGVEGVPALFPRRSFGALQQLDGDAGARGLLAAEGRLTDSSGGRLLTVSFEPAAVDIDTPEDYAALRRCEGE